MAFIEDIVSQAQKAGKFICDKAEDAKDYVSLEYKAISLKKKMDDQYKDLGKLIYDLSITETEDDGKVQESVALIKETSDEYTALIEQIGKYKKVCPQCHATSPMNANFCIKCGAALK